VGPVPLVSPLGVSVPPEIARHLDRLEQIIDLEHAEASVRLQEAAYGYRPVERIPQVLNFRDKVSKERSAEPDWPRFTYAESFDSPACMLLDELEDVYAGALLRDDKVYTIRANYGVGILPSLFGCEVHLESADSLPWVEPVTDLDVLRQTIARGVPQPTGGLLARVFETQEYFKETLAPYPKLSRTVRIAQADMQGPMNLASEILGAGVYTLLYDDPKLLHELLDVVTETYIAVTRLQKQVIGEELDRANHWHFRILAGARISEDFALSLSPRHYDEFARPYNERCYAAFGGGYLLYADEGIPALEQILDTPGITGIYRWTWRPEDLNVIWPLASARKVCLIWNGPLPAGWRDTYRTGMVLDQVVAGADEAREVRRVIRDE